MSPERCIPYEEIDIKYRLGPVSVPYNILVTYCAECNTDCKGAVIGFADWKGYGVVVRECPKCFEKYWHHCDRSYYGTLKLMLKLKEEGR